MNKLRNVFILCFAFGIIFSGCSMIGSLIGRTKIKEPEVSFIGAELSKLSFDAVDFLFDLKIRNPNNIGIKLASFDYDFLVNESSFVKGVQEKGLEISPVGEEVIRFPLSLRFSDIYQTFQTLRNQGISSYRINVGLSFNLPILGTTRIPVSKSGEFPLVKLPKLSLDSVFLENISLTGANLKIALKLDNPNIFTIILNNIKYQFNVNGQSLISGNIEQKVQINENGENIIQLPVSVNFLQAGMAVSQILTSNENLNYQLRGNIDIATSHKLLDQINLPFDLSGIVKLVR